jgi:hypothetical protein
MKTFVLGSAAPAPSGTGAKHAPKNFKYPDWNAAERLAAARKTVSFGQCRFASGTALDNEARMADRLAA